MPTRKWIADTIGVAGALVVIGGVGGLFLTNLDPMRCLTAQLLGTLVVCVATFISEESDHDG